MRGIGSPARGALNFAKEMIPKGSDAENEFFADILSGVKSLDTSQLLQPEDIEITCNSLQTIVATAWTKHAKTKLTSIRSKSWWNSECNRAKAVFNNTRSKSDYNTFR